MEKRIKLTLFAMVFVFGGEDCGRLAADVILEHSAVQIKTSPFFPGSTSNGLTETAATSSSLSGSGINTGNGTQTASASASSGGNDFQQFLRASAASSGNKQGPFVPIGQAWAVAHWQDILIPTGTGPHPDIDMLLTVEGILQADPVNVSFQYTQNVANLTLFVNGSVSAHPANYNMLGQTPNSQIGDAYAIVGQRSQNSNAVVDLTSFAGWEQASYTSGQFSGTFRKRLTYSQLLGGYGFEITVAGLTSANAGSAIANFGNSVSLTGIQNVDGSPYATPFSFNSGLTAIPEPSAWYLGWGVLSSMLAVSRFRSANRT